MIRNNDDIREKANEVAKEWFNQQVRNPYDAYYLFHKEGDMIVVSSSRDTPEGYYLSSAQRIPTSWTEEHASQWIYETARKLPILSLEPIVKELKKDLNAGKTVTVPETTMRPPLILIRSGGGVKLSVGNESYTPPFVEVKGFIETLNYDIYNSLYHEPYMVVISSSNLEYDKILSYFKKNDVQEIKKDILAGKTVTVPESVILTKPKYDLVYSSIDLPLSNSASRIFGILYKGQVFGRVSAFAPTGVYEATNFKKLSDKEYEIYKQWQNTKSTGKSKRDADALRWIETHAEELIKNGLERYNKQQEGEKERERARKLNDENTLFANQLSVGDKVELLWDKTIWFITKIEPTTIYGIREVGSSTPVVLGGHALGGYRLVQKMEERKKDIAKGETVVVPSSFMRALSPTLDTEPSDEVKNWMKKAHNIDDYKGGRSDRRSMLAYLINYYTIGDIRDRHTATNVAFALGKDLGYGTPPGTGISWERYFAEKIANETQKDIWIIQNAVVVTPGNTTAEEKLKVETKKAVEVAQKGWEKHIAEKEAVKTGDEILDDLLESSETIFRAANKSNMRPYARSYAQALYYFLLKGGEEPKVPIELKYNNNYSKEINTEWEEKTRTIFLRAVVAAKKTRSRNKQVNEVKEQISKGKTVTVPEKVVQTYIHPITEKEVKNTFDVVSAEELVKQKSFQNQLHYFLSGKFDFNNMVTKFVEDYNKDHYTARQVITADIVKQAVGNAREKWKQIQAQDQTSQTVVVPEVVLKEQSKPDHVYRYGSFNRPLWNGFDPGIPYTLVDVQKSDYLNDRKPHDVIETKIPISPEHLKNLELTDYKEVEVRNQLYAHAKTLFPSGNHLNQIKDLIQSKKILTTEKIDEYKVKLDKQNIRAGKTVAVPESQLKSRAKYEVQFMKAPLMKWQTEIIEATSTADAFAKIRDKHNLDLRNNEDAIAEQSIRKVSAVPWGKTPAPIHNDVMKRTAYYRKLAYEAKEKGNYVQAAEFYKLAIDNYPEDQLKGEMGKSDLASLKRLYAEMTAPVDKTSKDYKDGYSLGIQGKIAPAVPAWSDQGKAEFYAGYKAGQQAALTKGKSVIADTHWSDQYVTHGKGAYLIRYGVGEDDLAIVKANSEREAHDLVRTKLQESGIIINPIPKSKEELLKNKPFPYKPLIPKAPLLLTAAPVAPVAQIQKKVASGKTIEVPQSAMDEIEARHRQKGDSKEPAYFRINEKYEENLSKGKTIVVPERSLKPGKKPVSKEKEKPKCKPPVNVHAYTRACPTKNK